MWKILTVIAAVLLLGAAFFSYQNKESLAQRISELNSERQTLEARRAQLKEVEERIAMLNQSIMMLRDETEKLNTEKIDLDNKVVQAESELNLLTTQVQTAQAKLDRDRETIRKFPDIEDIRRQMAQARTEIEQTETEITMKEGQVAASEVEAERMMKIANELVALRKDQDAGIIRGPFQSTIRNAYNKWGFVVVNGGNDEGVVHNAQLDVYRRGQFIAKLLVTSVESGSSIADIIPGSLQPGQTVQPGDVVRKSVQVSTPAVDPSSAPAPAPAPTPSPTPAPAPGAPAADPFGGGMSPAPAGEPDPFGGGGMSTPPPAEPDPFGGGGSMTNDPFGGGGGTTPPPNDPFGQ